MTDIVEPRGPKPRSFFTPSRIMIYGVLIVAALYYLLPLYVMITTSLKGLPEIRLGNIFGPPLEVTFEPWVKAWTSACTGLTCEGLAPGFWNSVKITLPSTIISVMIAAVNGYALVNWRFKGSEVFFTVLLFGSFIPYQVMLYPLVLITAQLKIFGTLWAIILIHTIFGMPILTLLFRNYFSSLPQELFKAARVVAGLAPLKLALKSKSEQGYDLLADQPSRAFHGSKIILRRDASMTAAFQVIGRSVLRHIAANEPAVRAADPDGVHLELTASL